MNGENVAPLSGVATVNTGKETKSFQIHTVYANGRLCLLKIKYSPLP